MATEQRLIDPEPIKKFIVDGLNNPDPKKAFGHDAIEILTEIEYAPTVDAAPMVHGRWETIAQKTVTRLSRCTACGFEKYNVHWSDYCPNCGAKMDGDGDG